MQSFGLYERLSRYLSPFIYTYLWIRKWRGKEHRKRFSERLGQSSLLRPKGTLVWMHAASVGESVSILPLIAELLAQHKYLHVLVTTGTVTSAAMLESRLPARAFHQFVPVDTPAAVERFLNHWKPDLALWVESELWPNLILRTHAHHVPLLHINATMSRRSFRRWKKARTLAKYMLNRFSLTLAQTPDDAKRLGLLGARHVQHIGNLKLYALPLSSDPKLTGEMSRMIGDRPVWLAASTHPGEEEQIARVHDRLKISYPNLLTIIAPRHPKRGKTLLKNWAGKVALRSARQDITQQTDIYIADTLGELGLFMRVCGIVFVGGSLIPHGGHNPLEAARLECAIISGPHIEHFTFVYEELAEHNAYLRVMNEEELAHELDRLFTSPDARQALAEHALRVVNGKASVLEAYIEKITPFLETAAHTA